MTFITNYSNGTLSALNNLDNIYKLRRKSDGFLGLPARKTRIEENVRRVYDNPKGRQHSRMDVSQAEMTLMTT